MADFQSVESLNQQAQAGWDSQQAEFRKAAAYNALRQQYGDVAGDPQATLQMQKFGFDQQNNPLILQGNALQNTSAQQKIDYDQQQNPQLLQHQGLVNQGQGVTNAFNAAKTEQQVTDNGQQQGTQAHQILSTALAGLGDEAQGVTDPNQLGQLFDTHAQRAMSMINPNLPPDQARQQLAAERAQFVAGGAGAVPKIQADLDAALGASQSPLDAAKAQTEASRQALMASQAGAADAKASASKASASNAQGENTTKNLLAYPKIVAGAQKLQSQIGAGQGFIQLKLDSMLGDPSMTVTDPNTGAVKTIDPEGGVIGKTLALMNAVQGQNGWLTLTKGALDPQSPAGQLKANLETISHNVALVDLQNQKDNGLSLGKVSIPEFQAASQAILNPSVLANPQQLRTQLQKIATDYSQMRAAHLSQISQMQNDLTGMRNAMKGTVFEGPSAQDGIDPTQTNSIPPGGRIIPNFAAATSTDPLQQALQSAPQSLPAGMRNNNPGNIKYAGQAGTSPSANTDQGDPQAVYTTPQAGMNAMSALLQKKYDGGKTTPDAIIAGQGGWTPGNHDAAANVAKTMGISPTSDINMNDPLQKAKFMRALMLQEHGPKSRLYPDSMVLAAAGAGSGATGTATPPVQGAPDPGVQQQAATAQGQPAQSPLMQNDASAADPTAAVPQVGAKAGQTPAQQLTAMTPTQVATQPVALPSALDLRVPQAASSAQPAAKQGAAATNVVAADNILAKYGLARKKS